MAPTQLALLRGINVGGKHCIPMAALIELFSGLGCTDVATYIQSGNVVFKSPALLRAETVAAALEKRFGFAVPVVLRTAQAIAGVIAENPLHAPDGPDAPDGSSFAPRRLHVVFLAAPPTPAQIGALRLLLANGEKLAAAGSEMYLSLPLGAGRSKVALACVSSKLPASNTMRNWATVLKLGAMLGV